MQPGALSRWGARARRAFLGDVDIETVHGIPHTIPHPFSSRSVPCYHPAAALHSPELQALLQYDFRRLALPEGAAARAGEDPFARRRTSRPAHPMLRPDEPIAIDTEGGSIKPVGSELLRRGRVWVVTARGQTGVELRRADPRTRRPDHPAQRAARLAVLRAMGIELPHFIDTMISRTCWGWSRKA